MTNLAMSVFSFKSLFLHIPTFVQFNRGWVLGPVSCMEIDGAVSLSFDRKCCCVCLFTV